jgi:hypothetical protein
VLQGRLLTTKILFTIEQQCGDQGRYLDLCKIFILNAFLLAVPVYWLLFCSPRCPTWDCFISLWCALLELLPIYFAFTALFAYFHPFLSYLSLIIEQLRSFAQLIERDLKEISKVAPRRLLSVLLLARLIIFSTIDFIVFVNSIHYS